MVPNARNRSELHRAFAGDRPLRRHGAAQMKTLLFPTLLMGLSIGAAVMYAAAGDVWRAVYWAAATVITLAVTFQ
jgi:FtsH-binding integral membrane protein